MAVEFRKDISGLVVSSDTLASCFNLTRPRINQMADENVLVREANRKYLLLENIQRYVRYVKSSAKEEDGDEEFQAIYWEEKALHEKAKRELTEIRLDKTKGKMHEARDVELFMTEMLTTLRTQLLGLASQLAPRLAGKEQEEIYENINSAIEEKLQELSEYKPELFEGEIEDEPGEDT